MLNSIKGFLQVKSKRDFINETTNYIVFLPLCNLPLLNFLVQTIFKTRNLKWKRGFLPAKHGSVSRVPGYVQSLNPRTLLSTTKEYRYPQWL